MKYTWLLVVGGFLCVTGSRAADHYISPVGSSANDGSINSPWDIYSVVNDPSQNGQRYAPVYAGDTVWLRGGTYGYGTNEYDVWLVNTNGSPQNPITFRQYPGERAIINGGIRCFAPYITFWGFEITCTTARTNTQDGRPFGISLQGVGNRAINLVVHDTGQSPIGLSSTGTNVDREVYGCIVWGGGIWQTDYGWGGAPRGSGFYMQNDAGVASIGDNITFKNFTTGMKAYTEGGNVRGFHHDGNVSFGNYDRGYFVDSYSAPVSDIQFTHNYAYDNDTVMLGVYCPDLRDVEVLSNYWVTTMARVIEWGGWTKMVLSNNAFITKSWPNNGSGYVAQYQSAAGMATNAQQLSVDNNTYIREGASPGPLNFLTFAIYDSTWPTGARFSFDDWKTNYNWDSHSTFSTNVPTQNVVVVRPNKYERGRGHIIVYNWQSNATTTVDISGVGLNNGEAFQVRDVQNYFAAPILSAVYNSNSPLVTLPLDLTGSAPLFGDVQVTNYWLAANRPNPNVHTPSLFNTFVIMRSGAGPLTGASDLHILSSN